MTSGSAHGKSKLFVTDDRQCIIRHIIYFKPLNNAFTRHFICPSSRRQTVPQSNESVQLVVLPPAISPPTTADIYFEKLDFENILLGAGVFIWDSWEQFSNNHMSAVQSVTVQLFGSLSIGLMISSGSADVSATDLRRLGRLEGTTGYSVFKRNSIIDAVLSQLTDCRNHALLRLRLSNQFVLLRDEFMLLKSATLSETALDIFYAVTIDPQDSKLCLLRRLSMHPDRLIDYCQGMECFLPLIDAKFELKRTKIETPLKGLADMQLKSRMIALDNVASTNNCANEFRRVLERSQ